ncbi:MAG TPA: hypothetical protein EYG11_20715 [Candidatus Latescibacteria bacterium]|nr:hypothetical protein [Candidatus Handelsmanbacteria bacterium]HIL11127.1 hypothetical protein [Candidatus Latescibacterota bacterium]
MHATKLLHKRTVILCLLASVWIHVVCLVSLSKVDEEARVEVARLHLAADHFATQWLQLPRQSDLPPAAMEQLRMEAYLVAILSDSQWLSSWEIDGGLESGVEQSVKSPSLQAASNLVLYALTHTGGLATKRERLLWAAATGVTPMISGAQPF